MKDPQKDKLYKAEWLHSAYRRHDFRSIEAVSRWAHQIIGSAWFGCLFPHMAHTVVTFFDFGDGERCSAMPVNNSIDMAAWAWKKIIICHELAHLCNVDSEQFQANRADEGMGRRKKRGAASHGKKFAGIYLKIVEKAMGKEAARELEQNFNIFGVRYESKRR